MMNLTDEEAKKYIRSALNTYNRTYQNRKHDESISLIIRPERTKTFLELLKAVTESSNEVQFNMYNSFLNLQGFTSKSNISATLNPPYFTHCARQKYIISPLTHEMVSLILTSNMSYTTADITNLPSQTTPIPYSLTQQHVTAEIEMDINMWGMNDNPISTVVGRDELLMCLRSLGSPSHSQVLILTVSSSHVYFYLGSHGDTGKVIRLVCRDELSLTDRLSVVRTVVGLPSSPHTHTHSLTHTQQPQSDLSDPSHNDSSRLQTTGDPVNATVDHENSGNTEDHLSADNLIHFVFENAGFVKTLKAYRIGKKDDLVMTVLPSFLATPPHFSKLQTHWYANSAWREAIHYSFLFNTTLAPHCTQSSRSSEDWVRLWTSVSGPGLRGNEDLNTNDLSLSFIHVAQNRSNESVIYNNTLNPAHVLSARVPVVSTQLNQHHHFDFLTVSAVISLGSILKDCEHLEYSLLPNAHHSIPQITQRPYHHYYHHHRFFWRSANGDHEVLLFDRSRNIANITHASRRPPPNTHLDEASPATDSSPSLLLLVKLELRQLIDQVFRSYKRLFQLNDTYLQTPNDSPIVAGWKKLQKAFHQHLLDFATRVSSTSCEDLNVGLLADGSTDVFSIEAHHLNRHLPSTLASTSTSSSAPKTLVDLIQNKPIQTLFRLVCEAGRTNDGAANIKILTFLKIFETAVCLSPPGSSNLLPSLNTNGWPRLLSLQSSLYSPIHSHLYSSTGYLEDGYEETSGHNPAKSTIVEFDLTSDTSIRAGIADGRFGLQYNVGHNIRSRPHSSFEETDDDLESSSPDFSRVEISPQRVVDATDLNQMLDNPKLTSDQRLLLVSVLLDELARHEQLQHERKDTLTRYLDEDETYDGTYDNNEAHTGQTANHSHFPLDNTLVELPTHTSDSADNYTTNQSEHECESELLNQSMPALVPPTPIKPNKNQKTEYKNKNMTDEVSASVEEAVLGQTIDHKEKELGEVVSRRQRRRRYDDEVEVDVAKQMPPSEAGQSVSLTGSSSPSLPPTSSVSFTPSSSTISSSTISSSIISSSIIKSENESSSFSNSLSSQSSPLLPNSPSVQLSMQESIHIIKTDQPATPPTKSEDDTHVTSLSPSQNLPNTSHYPQKETNDNRMETPSHYHDPWATINYTDGIEGPDDDPDSDLSNFTQLSQFSQSQNVEQTIGMPAQIQSSIPPNIQGWSGINEQIDISKRNR